MSVLDWLNPFNKVADLVSEIVVDKDKKIAIDAELTKLKDQVYMMELQTKTIPWVDALHKMSRPIMGTVSAIAPVIVLIYAPDIPIEKLMLVMGGSIPTAIYTKIKGRGR